MPEVMTSREKVKVHGGRRYEVWGLGVEPAARVFSSTRASQVHEIVLW